MNVETKIVTFKEMRTVGSKGYPRKLIFGGEVITISYACKRPAAFSNILKPFASASILEGVTSP